MALSIVAVVIAVMSAGIALYSVHKTAKMTRYTYLANKWYDIKEKEFVNPDFADPSKTSSYETSFTGDSLKKYKTFAWTCWAHAEDVYRNHWHERRDFKRTLKWYKRLHYSWLKEPENIEHFNGSFVKYICEL